MPAGKAQHIVPQMMIRRFAAMDGTLIELHKPTLAVGTRRRHPSGILYRDHYYRDRFGNFDDELLKSVEQQFARYYPIIADGPADAIAKDGAAGAALIDWMASMLCRTPSFSALVRAVVSSRPTDCDDDEFGKALFSFVPDVMVNILRIVQFNEYQDLLSRPGWSWRLRLFDAGYNLVIMDNPVCIKNGLVSDGLIVLVPLTNRRILLGGLGRAVEECHTWSASSINSFLAAWADRGIFAADRETLNAVVRDLRGEGEIEDQMWCKAARKPLFGLPDRIAAMSIPESVDVGEFYQSMKDLYGRSILDRIRPRR